MALTHYAPVRYSFNIIFLSKLKNPKLKNFQILQKGKLSRTNIWGTTLFKPSKDFTLVVLIGLVGCNVPKQVLCTLLYVNVQHDSRLAYSRVRTAQQYALTLYSGTVGLFKHNPASLQQ